MNMATTPNRTDKILVADARIVIHHQDLVGAVGRSGHVHPRSFICNSSHCYQLAAKSLGKTLVFCDMLQMLRLNLERRMCL
jgi:hypothetical protein